MVQQDGARPVGISLHVLVAEGDDEAVVGLGPWRKEAEVVEKKRRVAAAASSFFPTRPIRH